MKRTVRALLRYTRSDMKWILIVAVILGVFGEGLGLLAFLLGEPEIAGKIALSVMLAFTFLISAILSIAYLTVQFPMFLSFPATRQGLIAGILLHGLRASVLQTAFCFVWGVADALVRRAVTGAYPLPWQWMPWWAWPLALVLPAWIGLFLGGVIQRFGAKGFWIVYLVGMLSLSSISHWLHGAAAWLAAFPWQAPVAVVFGCLAVATALSLRWIGRATVK